MFLLTHQHNTNPYLSDPDVILMIEFQEGDQASFESLMRKYFTRILNFIYRYVGDRQIAEDLAQSVFIKVYKNGASYQPKSKFQTWIFTIAKNTSLNELRRLNRKPLSLDSSMDDGEGGQMTYQISDPNAVDPEAQMMADERKKAIMQAIESLPENQRMAVLLRRYEDFSYEEIAETLNCSVDAVKSLLSRAKENLKAKLAHLRKI